MILPLRLWLSVARSAGLIGLIGAVLVCCRGADADDWTFREFPGQRMPSPEELNRLLGALQAEPSDLSGSAGVIRGLGPEITESLPPHAPQLSAEQRQRLEQLLKDSGVSISEWIGRRGSAANSASPRPPADISRPAPSKGRERPPSPAETESGGISSRLPDGGIDVQRALQLLNRRPAGVRPSEPGQELHRTDPEELLRHAESLGRELSRIDRPALIERESRPRGTAQPKAGSRSENWQGALGGEWNRILLGAAQRAAEMGMPAEDSSAGAPFSEESLDGFVAFARKWMQERPPDHGANPNRAPREVRPGDSESSAGFPWSMRWPEVQTAALAPAPGGPAGPAMLPSSGEPLWPLAISSCLGLSLLLAALRARRRNSGRDGSRCGAVPLSGIESAEDLVQAVDRLLMIRYGAEASWWDCRAVERALVRLRPDRRVAMSRLATYYRRARYAPSFRQLTGAQLKHSARMLQQLAGSLNSIAEGVRSLHTAA